uniref:Uncharacterized protein n=1 Tax=Anguilla anguilla TaxID=7936 RepID=A0A0E9TNF6_ANGAN
MRQDTRMHYGEPKREPTVTICD